MQAGVSQDDVIPASPEFVANSRYNIPDELSYTHEVIHPMQAVKHSGDHLSLDSHPIHLSAHPIPFPGMNHLLFQFYLLTYFVSSLIILPGLYEVIILSNIYLEQAKNENS